MDNNTVFSNTAMIDVLENHGWRKKRKHEQRNKSKQYIGADDVGRFEEGVILADNIVYMEELNAIVLRNGVTVSKEIVELLEGLE